MSHLSSLDRNYLVLVSKEYKIYIVIIPVPKYHQNS
jgi:hypothetical protein